MSSTCIKEKCVSIKHLRLAEGKDEIIELDQMN